MLVLVLVSVRVPVLARVPVLVVPAVPVALVVLGAWPLALGRLLRAAVGVKDRRPQGAEPLVTPAYIQIIASRSHCSVARGFVHLQKVPCPRL